MVCENLNFFCSADQRRPAQTWSKKLPTIIFLISIVILWYYKLLQSTSDTCYQILSTWNILQSRIFNLFLIFMNCVWYMKIWTFFQSRPAQTSVYIKIIKKISAQTSADLVKKASNSNILISFVILGYYNLLQSTSDTFYPLLVTLKTLQSRMFILFFMYCLWYMKIWTFFSAQTSIDQCRHGQKGFEQ